MKITLVIISLTLLIAAGAIAAFLFQCEDDWCFVFEWQKIRAAKSFERCESLGFPIMGSYPRQCRAGNKTFAEEVRSKKTELIRVSTPTPDELVQSPLTIQGEARGNWYFEASFPVRLFDANGKELAVIPAQAKNDWMTTNFVPFEATLVFPPPKTYTGTLVLEKDNPSGLPEYADKIEIPVRFKQIESAEDIIKLYYYNAEKDKDENGNIMCSRNGLAVVERKVPLTITPIQDSIRLLLEGTLTVSERAQGITTEYPLPGFALKGASLKNGLLTLTFADPENKSGGGSCRVGILWFQIEATAKQFPGVTTVQFMPEELFQP